MAVSKSQKIQAEIDKVKAKISEQQARLKELEQKKLEAENSEIVEIVRGMSISWRSSPDAPAAPGRHFWTKCPEVRGRRKGGKLKMKRFRAIAAALCAAVLYADLASRPMPTRTEARARTMAIPP